jgi:hypothetical protein
MQSEEENSLEDITESYEEENEAGTGLATDRQPTTLIQEAAPADQDAGVKKYRPNSWASQSHPLLAVPAMQSAFGVQPSVDKVDFSQQVVSTVRAKEGPEMPPLLDLNVPHLMTLHPELSTTSQPTGVSTSQPPSDTFKIDAEKSNKKLTLVLADQPIFPELKVELSNTGERRASKRPVAAAGSRGEATYAPMGIIVNKQDGKGFTMLPSESDSVVMGNALLAQFDNPSTAAPSVPARLPDQQIAGQLLQPQTPHHANSAGSHFKDRFSGGAGVKNTDHRPLLANLTGLERLSMSLGSINPRVGLQPPEFRQEFSGAGQRQQEEGPAQSTMINFGTSEASVEGTPSSVSNTPASSAATTNSFVNSEGDVKKYLNMLDLNTPS